jgi:hypothetical protein
VEWQVRAPCLVHDQRAIVFVTDVCDSLDVSARAVVGRGDEKHALGVRFGFEGGPDLVHARRMREVEVAVTPWPHPNRPDQTGDRGFMRVPGDQQLLVRPATASIALFTDSELPQVEKNACSAWTASAIRSGACDSNCALIRRSSRPLRERRI